MNIKDRLPGIARAYLEMERCNGGINRLRTETDALEDLERFIAADGLDVAMDLPAIDTYFAGLPDDELQTAVDGEEGEREQLLASAPDGSDQLLNALFDRNDLPLYRAS